MKNLIDYNSLVSEYAQHRKANPAVLKQLIELGRIEPSSRVLEVGCGTGNYISAIQRLTGCSAYGCDPSREMLVQAEKRGQPVQFQEGRGESLPYPDTSFDLIFSIDVIHHIEQPSRYFLEANRALRAQGKICTVTESSYLIRRRRPFAIYFPETVAVDLRRYPRISELKRNLGNAGFTGMRSEIVKMPFELVDIQDFRDQAYSCLHLISADGFRRGVEQMDQDLKNGPIPFISNYLFLWAGKE